MNPLSRRDDECPQCVEYDNAPMLDALATLRAVRESPYMPDDYSGQSVPMNFPVSCIRKRVGRIKETEGE